MNNELRASLKKLWKSLTQNDVHCMIVGGVAVGFYGYERQSIIKDLGSPELIHDIDLWYHKLHEPGESPQKSGDNF